MLYGDSELNAYIVHIVFGCCMVVFFFHTQNFFPEDSFFLLSVFFPQSILGNVFGVSLVTIVSCGSGMFFLLFVVHCLSASSSRKLPGHPKRGLYACTWRD